MHFPENIAIYTKLLPLEVIETNYPRLVNIPLAFALASAATIVAVKILDSYNPDTLSPLKFKLIKFEQDNPTLPTVLLIFLLTMGLLSAAIGVFMAVPFGIYNGWRCVILMANRKQKMLAEGNYLQNPNHQLALR